MFVTRKHYEDVVAELRGQISDLRERLQEEALEKDWYRRTFFANHGFQYAVTESKPGQVAAETPIIEPVVDGRTMRKTFKLNRDEWTVADKRLFASYLDDFCKEEGVPKDEAEFAYYEKYGNAPPIVAWSA